MSYNNKYLVVDSVFEERPWKPCLVDERCQCRQIAEAKRRAKANPLSNRTSVSEGLPLAYPIKKHYDRPDLTMMKTFQMEYKGHFSKLTINILTSFQKKYIYYAIDEISELLNTNERKILLSFFYSSMISLHNDFSINFFDIWIDMMTINYSSLTNRFLINQPESRYITHLKLKLNYKTKLPIKKPEPIW